MRIILIISSFLVVNFLFAQNEGNIWYFGEYAGIDFNSGTPVALSNSAMYTPEGCASICDNNGNLLFYTHGETIYNSNHVPMPNGTGLPGNPSSVQSSIVIKKPGSNAIYYVFTMDAVENSFANGFQYVEVDMTLQGGLGDVSMTLAAPIYAPNISEQLTAIQHQNGVDFWVIIRTNDSLNSSFRSYLLTASGLSTTPVITNLLNFNAGWTGLSGSPNGQKLASASSLFDFDNLTGVISNHVELFTGFYDGEFSPNSQYFYTFRNVVDSITNVFSQQLLQFDCMAGTANDIINSEIIIWSSNGGNGFRATMQLAPDNKIYVAKGVSSFLGVISNPNFQGISCNYLDNGFPLANGTLSLYGLPALVGSYVTEFETAIEICQGDSTYLYKDWFQNYNWALASSPNTIISNDSSIIVSPIIDTDYIVYDGPDTFYFKITVNPLPNVNLGADLVICPGNVNVLTNIDSVAADASYLWQDGTTNDSLNLYSTGTYWLEVTDGLGCIGSDTVLVSSVAEIDVIVGHPTCHDAANGSFNVIFPGADSILIVIKNSMGTILNTPNFPIATGLSAGTYVIEYTDGNCMAIDSIALVNPPIISADVIVVDPLCFGDSTGAAFITNLSGYQGPLAGVYYNWTPNPQQNNGLFTDSIHHLSAREYSVGIIDELACQTNIVFSVTEPLPLVGVITDIKPTFCRTSGFQSGNGSVSVGIPLETSGTGNTDINWLHLGTGETANVPQFVAKAPGHIALALTDDNGCVFRDSVYLDSLNPKADFIITSDNFDVADIYEGTEDVKIRVKNQSTNFHDPNNSNSDIVFQWNLFTNMDPGGEKNWFFTYDLSEQVDTIYEGEQVYQVCLIAKNYNDCADTTCKDVIVHAAPLLVMPNVFTPGSFPNGTFYFPYEGIAEFNCVIFNRYGVKVFEFNDILEEWDGNHYKSNEPCSDGVYFYQYSAKSTNGSSIYLEGHLSLIRDK
ncbi:MAG: gliding motility-associated C-terminal domain-containing protein [Crocinitomicaceae bacterium]